MVSLNIKFSNKTFYSILIISILLIVTGIGIALDSGDPLIHGHTADEIEGMGNLCLSNGSDVSCVETWDSLKIKLGTEIGGVMKFTNPGLNENDNPCVCNPIVAPDNCWCLTKTPNNPTKTRALVASYCGKQGGLVYYGFTDSSTQDSEKQIRKKCTAVTNDLCSTIEVTGDKSKNEKRVYLSEIYCITRAA